MQTARPYAGPALLLMAGLLVSVCVLVGSTGSSALAAEQPTCPDGYVFEDPDCVSSADPISVPCPDQAVPSSSLLSCITEVDADVLECPDQPVDSPCSIDVGEASFDPPAIDDPGCPAGSRGTAGGCFLYVAREPARGCDAAPIDTNVCATVHRTCTGEMLGDLCIVEGGAPVEGPSTCPEHPRVVQNGCYAEFERTSWYRCELPYEFEAGGCRYDDELITDSLNCPSAYDQFPTLSEVNADGTPIGPPRCMYPAPPVSACPAPSYEFGENTCRHDVPREPGDMRCAVGFDLLGDRCVGIAGSDPIDTYARPCPTNAVSDHEGHCRLIVNDVVTTACPGTPVAGVRLHSHGTCIAITPVHDACPPGFSFDDLGDGRCTQVDEASVEVVCPDGSTGIPGGCYNPVAKVSDAECLDKDIAHDGLCYEVDLAYADGSCFGDFTAIDGACLRVRPTTGPFACDDDAIIAGEFCLVYGAWPKRQPGTCPSGDDIVQEGCYWLRNPVDNECPSGSTRITVDGVVECRVAVPLIPGDLYCDYGYFVLDNRCRALAEVETQPTVVRCPTDSFENATGACVKLVADVVTYSCRDAGAVLMGTSCLSTAASQPSCVDGVARNGRCVVYVERSKIVDCSVADTALDAADCINVGLSGEVQCPSGYSTGKSSWCESRVSPRSSTVIEIGCVNSRGEFVPDKAVCNDPIGTDEPVADDSTEALARISDESVVLANSGSSATAATLPQAGPVAETEVLALTGSTTALLASLAIALLASGGALAIGVRRGELTDTP